MADVALNCEKLNCPMPIVRISQTIKTMLDGQTLEVTAADPAFSADVQAPVTHMVHQLVLLEGGTLRRAIIRKRPGKGDSQCSGPDHRFELGSELLFERRLEELIERKVAESFARLESSIQERLAEIRSTGAQPAANRATNRIIQRRPAWHRSFSIQTAVLTPRLV